MISHTIRKDYSEIKTFWIYLSADDHIGHPNFDYKMWKEQHDEAKEKNAIILKFGDLGELIKPGDWRYTQDLDSYHRNDYYNAIEQETAEYLMPYVDNLYMMSMGNHEDKVVRRDNNDYLRGVLRILNSNRNRNLPPIFQGDYRGFYKIKFCRVHRTNWSGILPYSIFYYHGKGGAAEVTGGAITLDRLSRMAMANLIVSAHIHEAMVRSLNSMWYMTSQDTPKEFQRFGIILSTFKDTIVKSESVKIGDIDERGHEITYERGGEIKGGYKASFEEKFRGSPYKLGGTFVKVKIVHTEKSLDAQTTIQLRC